MILMALEMEFRGPLTKMKANALGKVPWNLEWFPASSPRRPRRALDESHVSSARDAIGCVSCERNTYLFSSHLTFIWQWSFCWVLVAAG